MTDKGRVVWTEGMFLRPQHFQQQTRYFESFIEARVRAISDFNWGLVNFEFDQELMLQGKLSLASASGILPDGTPFSLPERDTPPLIIEVGSEVKNQIVYLTLPERRSGMPEMQLPDSDTISQGRLMSSEISVIDTASLDPSEAPIHTASLVLGLRLESQPLEGFTRIPLCKIIEVRTDKSLLLDESFIPSVLNLEASKVLLALISEIRGLLLHRAEALRGRVSASGQGGNGEISDFLFLQLVNRYLPLMVHYDELKRAHPERLYSDLLQIAGEMATFSESSRLVPDFGTYNHTQLTESFDPVVNALRQSLSMVLEQTAVQISLQERRYGIIVGTVSDVSLLSSASFVLAVTATMDLDVLRQRFPSQAKLGSVENIRQLVNVQLPGIKLRPLPVAPRQVPYHTGYVYFELDKSGDLWKDLGSSGGLAMHIGGEFPELKMELWAVRY